MSLARTEPALKAIRCPSADQDGWETAGRSGVMRRTPVPSGFITNRASGPSRSETKAINSDSTGGGSFGGVQPASGDSSATAIKIETLRM